MSDPSAQLARVRRQRRKVEAKLPEGTYLAADLDDDQRRAFDQLGRLLTREQDLLGAEWFARGGRLLTAPGRRPRFRESRRAVPARAPRTPSARPRGKNKARARRVSRTSTRSGDSGDDPGEAPPAAREAVADAWERILRRRHPGTAWEVRARAERTASKR